MDVSVLEGLDHAENLIDVTADGEIVHGHLTEDTLAVNDVGGTESDASITTVLDKAAVVLGDLLGQVRDHGECHLTEATLSTWLHGVLAMSEVGVDRDTDELGLSSLELSGLVRELADLSWAHEGEVKRPEEEDDVFA